VQQQQEQGAEQQQEVIVQLLWPTDLTQLVVMLPGRYSWVAGCFLPVDYYRLTPFYKV
jgi:hypothetical protein